MVMIYVIKGEVVCIVIGKVKVFVVEFEFFVLYGDKIFGGFVFVRIFFIWVVGGGGSGKG